jgi:hypothetical protein
LENLDVMARCRRVAHFRQRCIFFIESRNFQDIHGLIAQTRDSNTLSKPKDKAMKTKSLLVVAAVVSLTGLLNAEEGKRPIRPDNRVKEGEGHPDRPLPPEIMEKFDTKKDGKLDEEEREAFKKARMEKEAEFRKKMLEKFDKDGNGELSEAEKEEMQKAMWKERAMRFDKNGDGELSEEEKEEMKKAMREHERRGPGGGPNGGPDKPKDWNHDERRPEPKEKPAGGGGGGVLGE